MHISHFIAPALAIALIGSATDALALDIDSGNSKVNVVSTKVLADGTSSVAEIFTFNSLEGSVDDSGEATVTIDLGAIETGIDIRNERMGEYLFETDRYPTATITAQVPETALAPGQQTLDLEIGLDMHGKQATYTLPVLVASDAAQVTVTAEQPLLLDVTAFDLQGGLGKLGELAGLLHIPATVPVTFSLTFNR
ncbi:YceI family protein [Granulosicoccus sp. 3-233]|uniref:YceI family protein n=1 Tax=Granulosicoccus sp. 3-233 TaxID=3417969 RepID=UPI003D341BC6